MQIASTIDAAFSAPVPVGRIPDAAATLIARMLLEAVDAGEPEDPDEDESFDTKGF